MHYVYLIKSIDTGKVYTGMTNDLKRRFNEHLAGKVHTTHRMGEIKLIFYEAFVDKRDAVRRENYLKTSKGKQSLKQIIRYSIL